MCVLIVCFFDWWHYPSSAKTHIYDDIFIFYFLWGTWQCHFAFDFCGDGKRIFFRVVYLFYLLAISSFTTKSVMATNKITNTPYDEYLHDGIS